MAPGPSPKSTTVMETTAFVQRDSKTSGWSPTRRKKSTAPSSRTSILNRSKASPVQTRAGLSEKYEQYLSGREGWWRQTMKETPIPGSYESQDFLYDLEKTRNTYRFKGDGRKMDPHPHGKGATLLPGAYDHHDFLYRLTKFNTRYTFKDTGRDKRDFMTFGVKDKDMDTDPTAYEMEKYLSISAEKLPSKHFFFKSQSQRFPTIYFTPKTGPAPGNYEYTTCIGERPVRSSFKSTTPRFKTSHNKIPGPGSYEKTFQHPMPASVSKMGRQHGLFFSSAFQV